MHFVGIGNYVLGSCFARSTFQKGSVCIYVRNGVAFNCPDLSKYCKEKNLEICAVQIENTGKRMVVICLYRSPSGDFKQFLKLLDLALLSLNNPYMEVLLCGDFNVDYLSNCTRKQELSILLGTYNMIHTVDFPTRLQNGHSSTIDNIFLDKSRSQSYKIIPLTNALSDHEAQCIILNKFFTDSKQKYTCRVRLIVKV